MTKQEILDWLQAEIENYPEGAYWADFYDFMVRQAGKIVASDRTALIEAMMDWLQRRDNPYIFLAMKIAVAHKLSELAPALEKLREDIVSGRAFLPYYVEWVDRALRELDGDVQTS